tara:strand:+ start:3260 stop:4654 length:1395 start_codon:yes stop_codon:yes gene_type:complete
MKFEELNLGKNLLEAIKKLGFESPTQIQEKSIPHILKGKDVIGESATGSGKTLAFGTTIVENTIKNQGLQSLVLTPTRELAEQVKEDLKKLSSNKHLNIITLFGGVSINRQIQNLPKSEIVIATPGRLLDHIQRQTINLKKIKILVMDEADRMFDMGFIDDVERIIQFCPKKRQTLFFSATITPNIKNLAKKYMINPVTVLAENKVDPKKLKQVCYNLPQNMKLSLLIDLLKKESIGLSMVFCNTRRSVDFVVKNIKKNNINATAIHGGLSQNKRTKTMYMFHDSKREVLVCTDVASRGLHIENVTYVYNFDIPLDPKDYVHRIGRTARAGKKGRVINFLSPRDYHNYDRITSEYNTFIIDNLKTPELKRIHPVRVEDDRYSQRRSYHQRGPRRDGRGPPKRNERSPQRGYQGRDNKKPYQRRDDKKPKRGPYKKDERPQQRRDNKKPFQGKKKFSNKRYKKRN